jgi:hypothetical protein
MIHWVEEHPYLTGSFVLVAVVLFFILRGSSSNSNASGGVVTSNGPSESLQAAQLASATQLQESQNAATVAQNTNSAEVAAAQIKANSDVTQAQLAQQTALQNIVTSGQVQEQTNSTALQSVVAQIGGQVQVAKIGADENVAIANTQAATLKAQYDDAVQSQSIISTAQTAQAKANADLQLGIVTSNNEVKANQDTISGNIAYTELVNQNNVDTINGNLAYANIEAQKDLGSQTIAANVNANNNLTSVQQSYLTDQTTLGLATIDSQNQAQNLDYAAHINDNGYENNYLTQLTQLKAYGKDTSGLPGTDNTLPSSAMISAAQPGNSTGGIINAALNGLGNIGKALFGV